MDPHGTPASFLGALAPERAEEIARGSPDQRAAAIQELIRKTSALAAVAAQQPVPVLDLAILTPLQHRLVRSVGLIHGCRLSDQQIDRIFRAIRRPIAVSQTMLAAAKLLQWIPWVPEIFAASLAYALTFAIGQASDEFLSRPIDVNELSSRMEQISGERFKATLNAKWEELRSLFRNPETRREIERVNKRRREGEIDEEEGARRIDALLRGESPRNGKSSTGSAGDGPRTGADLGGRSSSRQGRN